MLVSFWFTRVWLWRLWFQSIHLHCGVFTVFLLISNGFPVWRLGISTLHNRSPPVWMLCCPCEHFEIKTFTLETVENQKKTSIAWIGEYFFREIKYVYIRAQREPSPNRLELFQRDYSAISAQPHAAWSSLHKSPTISHKSLSRQNKSLSRQNKSRTCGRQLPDLWGENNLENNLFRTLLQKSTKKICSLVQKPYFCSRIPEGVLRETL